MTWMLIQLVPIGIILFFVIRFSGTTGNAGWMLEEKTGCKAFTFTNYENRSFTWDGACVDGFAHGKGKLILLQNGYKYHTFDGTLLKGKAQGFGKSTMLDGDTYEGNYQGGLAHGPGRSYNDEGDYFEGTFLNGLRSGRGTYWYEPTSRFLKYVGAWKAGKRHGTGTLFYRDGEEQSLTFKNGVLTEDQ